MSWQTQQDNKIHIDFKKITNKNEQLHYLYKRTPFFVKYVKIRYIDSKKGSS